jgi:hypothetical protein
MFFHTDQVFVKPRRTFEAIEMHFLKPVAGLAS